MIAEVKNMKAKTWTKDKFVALSISISAIASSIYFPGAGFLVFLPLQSRLGQYKKITIYTLVFCEVVYLLTAWGTMFGPLISKVGPEIQEN